MLQRCRRPALNNPASQASLSPSSLHPLIPSSLIVRVRRSFFSTRSRSFDSKEASCCADILVMLFILKDLVKVIQATTLCSRMNSGVLVFNGLFLVKPWLRCPPPFHSGSRAMAHRRKSSDMKRISGLMEENSTVIEGDDR